MMDYGDSTPKGEPTIHSSTPFTRAQIAQVSDGTDDPWVMVVTNEPRLVIVCRDLMKRFAGVDYHLVKGFEETVELAIRILKLLAPGYKIILDDQQNDPYYKERFLAIIETREVLKSLGSLDR